MKKRIVSSRKAAEFLGISVRHLHYLRRHSLIPYIRAGYRTILYEIEDLEAYLAQNKVKSISYPGEPRRAPAPSSPHRESQNKSSGTIKDVAQRLSSEGVEVEPPGSQKGISC